MNVKKTNKIDILITGLDHVSVKIGYLVNAYQKKGLKVLVYSLDKTGLSKSIADRWNIPLKIVPKNIIFDIFTFLGLLLKYRPRHVEFYMTRLIPEFFYGIFCFILRIPIVVVCRGELYYYEKMKLIRKLIDHFIYFLAKLVILRETYMEEKIQKYKIFNLNKAYFLHNSIPIQNKNITLTKAPNILFLNSLKPWRKVEILIRAFPIILKEMPQTRLLIVGSTLNMKNYNVAPKSYERSIMELINKLGLENYVEIYPFTDNPFPFYERASIFVLPADVVFCNYALLEAMACGLVPVVANVKDADKIVEHGVNGFLCEQKPEAFAQAIIKLLKNENLRVSMAKKAREKIEKEFNIETMINKLISLYKEKIWKR